MRRIALCLSALSLAWLTGCDTSAPTVPVGPSSGATRAEVMEEGGHHIDGPAAGLKLIAEGMASPVTLMQPPGESQRLFVVDQMGVIWIVTREGGRLPTPFLDLRSRITPLMPFYDERGLLGLAFHPDFQSNGRFFVFYSAPPRLPGYDNVMRLSEFRVASPDADVAVPGSERVILEVDEPQFNHEGGTIAFGPGDGYLYVSLGDGGNKNDIGFGHVEDWYAVNEGGNGQDIEQNLLGNVLRINVDAGAPYSIPSDNPFVGTPGLDEIWAYGFRNPYRFSFDMGGSHAMILGEAGQDLWEEIDVVTKGGNYGWNVKEGFTCFNAADEDHPLPSCPSTDPAGDPLIDPVIVLLNAHHGGLTHAVIGGYIYRGSMLPQFRGRYIFGGFSTSETMPDGSVYIAMPRDGRTWPLQELHFPRMPGNYIGDFVKGLGQDNSGEIYVLSSDQAGPIGTSGKVYRLTGVSDTERAPKKK